MTPPPTPRRVDDKPADGLSRDGRHGEHRDPRDERHRGLRQRERPAQHARQQVAAGQAALARGGGHVLERPAQPRQEECEHAHDDQAAGEADGRGGDPVAEPVAQLGVQAGLHRYDGARRDGRDHGQDARAGR
ncbi:hypothetical protein WBK31_16435 [Nonomuraea sp. N2-4H]